jgi:hypothetical protein
LKHGKGLFIFSDGARFEGEFEKDFMKDGRLVWPDGRTYTGQFKDNKMHGLGVFTWPDGRKYEGEYVDDKKDG